MPTEYLFCMFGIKIRADIGNRGLGGYFGIPPLAENFSKIPPPPHGDFEKIRHFVPEIEEKRENFA